MTSPLPDTKNLCIAWIVCAAILIAVEGALHALPARVVLRFDQHGYSLGANLDYTTVRRINRVMPAAEVLILGSSREREGFVVPYLKEQLNLRDVRNYAQANGRAPSQCALVRLLKETHHLPRVLIYGVTPLQLNHIEEEHFFTSCFVQVTDLFSSETPLESRDRLKYLGNICLSTADRFVRTLWLRELVRAPGNQPGGARGGYTRRQISLRRAKAKNDEQSLTNPRDASDNKRARTARVDLGISKEEALKLNEGCARQALHIAAAGGCKIIVVELPVSHWTQKEYSPGTYENFVRFFEETCRQEGGHFIRVRDLGIDMADSEMLDDGHLNWSGADKFTRALTEYLQRHADMMGGESGHVRADIQ